MTKQRVKNLINEVADIITIDKNPLRRDYYVEKACFMILDVVMKEIRDVQSRTISKKRKKNESLK